MSNEVKPGRQMLRERLAQRDQALGELRSAVASLQAPKPDNALLLYAGSFGVVLGLIVGLLLGGVFL